MIVNDKRNPKVFGLVWLCLGQCCKSESGIPFVVASSFKCGRSNVVSVPTPPTIHASVLSIAFIKLTVRGGVERSRRTNSARGTYRGRDKRKIRERGAEGKELLFLERVRGGIASVKMDFKRTPNTEKETAGPLECSARRGESGKAKGTGSGFGPSGVFGRWHVGCSWAIYYCNE